MLLHPSSDLLCWLVVGFVFLSWNLSLAVCICFWQSTFHYIIPDCTIKANEQLSGGRQAQQELSKNSSMLEAFLKHQIF